MILKIVKSVLAFTDFVQTNCRLRSTSMNNKSLKKNSYIFSSSFPLLYLTAVYVFTARRVYIARTICHGKMSVCPSARPSVRLSVCLLHAGIESKRLYTSAKFFHYRIAPPF